MVCPVSDEQLLLSVHGELGMGATAKVALHTLGCPACKARRAEFQRAAAATAALIRDPSMPMWVSGWLKPATATVVGAVSVLTTVLAVAFLAFWINANTPKAVPAGHFVSAGGHPHCTKQVPIAPSAQIGCKPGLATDKCQ